MPTTDELRVRHLLGVLDEMNDGDVGDGHDPRISEGPRVAVGLAHVPLTVQPVATLNTTHLIRATDVVDSRWGRNTALAHPDTVTMVQRKKWEISKIPRFEIEPAPTLGTPRREGDYLLWNDTGQGRIYFALAVPRLVSVAVVIRREHVSNTFKITGGSVTLTVSAYDRIGPQVAQRLHDLWYKTLIDRKSPALAPKVEKRRDESVIIERPLLKPKPDVEVLPRYEPLVLRGLEASLETDPSFLAGEVSVTVSPDVGSVTFVIPLSELGAQAWRSALDLRRGDLITGVCRLTARYYATAGSKLSVEPIQLSAPLGALLAGRGPEIMQVLNAQTTIDARVIVSGHQTLDTVIIDWRPSEGHAPESLIFNSEGGSFNGPITSENIERVVIDWSAQVRFKPSNWPIIRQQGRLSVASTDWTLMVRPESWVTEYAMFVVLLDSAGAPIPQGASAGDGDRVQCEVRFTAPFLEGGAAITTTFESTSQSLNRIAVPVPPGQSPGEVRLTVFAQRGGESRMRARLIQASETFTIITVYASAAIDFTVNAPEGGETLAGELLALASQLG